MKGTKLGTENRMSEHQDQWRSELDVKSFIDGNKLTIELIIALTYCKVNIQKLICHFVM